MAGRICKYEVYADRDEGISEANRESPNKEKHADLDENIDGNVTIGQGDGVNGVGCSESG